jgi:outer membrane lipase/esterase
MRFSSKLLCTAGLAIAAGLFSSPAAAQRVDRVVAFGDSYADDGNFFELTGIPRPAVYPNGRFSNGTNFVDTIGLLLGVPIDNFAIGGAFTGNGNINGPGIPGFVTEYQSFLAGGGPAAFPRVSGSFDANDLVVVSIGGNDARAYERSLGLAPTTAQIAALTAGAPAQAALRVAEATTGLNALVGAGARNITFLAGDVGRLPEVRGLPVAAVGSAYASAFNTGIQSSLSNIASQGVIVNYLDLNRIGDVVEANLSAFNLISAGACPVACVTTDPSLLDRYLFYVDQVHLTSAGFAIVGRYAVQQLEAPLTLESQRDMGLSVASNFGQLMSGRLDLAEDNPEQPLSFYVSGQAANHDVAGSNSSLAYDYDSVAGVAGLEYASGSSLFGAAVSYARPRVELLGTAGRNRGEAWQAGAYAHIESGGAFAEAYGGYGWLSYDMRRRAVINEISAETDGKVLVAGGEVGYLMNAGDFKAGPVAGVQYTRVTIDGYSETGDPVLVLNVQDQRASELVGFAGLETEFDAEVGGLGVQPFVKLLAEKQLDSSGSPIRYALQAAPTIVNTFNLGQSSDDLYGRAEGGVTLDLGSRIALQVQASGTFEHPEHDEFSGSVALKLKF